MYGYVVFAAAATILLGANAIVSHVVARSDFYDARQKAVQIALIWLLPVVGLLLVGGVLWSNDERPASIGDHPEHRIPDYAGSGGGADPYNPGGPST
jgi:hypothetical protein